MLRVAAIDFLNPAPLMWDFTHAPRKSTLAGRYQIHLTTPAQCARELLANEADLGLIPVAALTPELAIVPGCCIASLHHVRSIQLILRPGLTLADVQTVATDTASRSSVAYTQVLFRHFLQTDPTFLPAAPDPEFMLDRADAALLIGDPALLALERRAQIDRRVQQNLGLRGMQGPLTWFDLAHEWRTRTNLPWVAAVWALRQDAAADLIQLTADLNRSREAGQSNTGALVEEWTQRIALPPATIRTYLTENIHYTLDPSCLEAIRLFRRLAAEVGALPPLEALNLLPA